MVQLPQCMHDMFTVTCSLHRCSQKGCRVGFVDQDFNVLMFQASEINPDIPMAKKQSMFFP